MLSTLRSNLTYANVMATTAVFIALGGSSYAAIKVTGRNVKDSSLTGRDVKRDSLTGADVKRLGTKDIADGSLRPTDFKQGVLPAGPQGPKGDQGPPATSLWAVVNSNGTLRRGSRVVSVDALGSAANRYIKVRFDRDVSNCAQVVSLSYDQASHANTGEIAAHTTTSPEPEPESVTIQGFESSGYSVLNPPVNKDFQLAVFC